MTAAMASRWFGLLVLSLAASAHGQSLTSRLSTQQFTTVYGGGGDAASHSSTESRNTLDPFDTMPMFYADSRSGTIPGKPKQPYSATVDIDLSQQYVLTGWPGVLSRIEASGATQVESAVTGAGISQIISINPGNLLDLGFSVATTIDVRLVGAVSLEPGAVPFSGADVSLLRSEGSSWILVFSTSIELPGGEGIFDREFSLAPGDYRIVGQSLGNTFLPGGSPGQVNSWSYDLIVCGAGDLNCDGTVDAADLSILLGSWGPCSGCDADTNGDGTVDGADLSILLANWG